MPIGLIARKVGMTRIFSDDGASIPVTVLDAANNRVTQVKSMDKDGYAAVQVARGTRRPGRVSKSVAGHFSKAGVEAGSVVREFPLGSVEGSAPGLGAALSVSQFTVGQKVDVSAATVGKGFAGSIKRHNFASQRASHGNSVSHQAPGSIGMAQDPGRVFPGKRMAGHLGDVMATTQNLEVVRIDEARQLILVRGAVPGARGGDVLISPAVKAGGK